MAIIGFNFYKMDVSRKEGASGNLKVNNNVNIEDVKEYEISFGQSKQKGLRFMFGFTSQYEPKAGTIKLEGDVIFLAPNEEVDEILKDWKKNKKIKPAVLTSVLNYVLSKCNIKALLLSQDVNLPSPIPLPRVSAAEGKKPK